jgi:hypothetical protein
VILLEEASYGTSEFYQILADLTNKLIEEKVFGHSNRRGLAIMPGSQPSY